MCAICGCAGAAHVHDHDHENGHGHGHGPDPSSGHGHDHGHPVAGGRDHARDGHGSIDFGAGPGGQTIPGLGQGRTLRIERDVLATNNALARANRDRLARAGVFALNLVSSPGSGKTSLLARVIDDLKRRRPIIVIEGDQQTSRDAERIRATGAPAVQINTGKGCHLDAHMVGHALDRLPLEDGGLLFIENVGNLVCPAAFDLGEAHKVVVLSVTEGEDKPLKYPDMFAAADLMLLNKIDLLPHLDFDVGECLAAAQRVNPRIQILPVSARTGAGLEGFHAWIEARAPRRAPPRPDVVAGLADAR